MSLPFLGYGLGLRQEFYDDVLQAESLPIDWFEVISENYMHMQGRPLETVETIRQDYPFVMHGVSMSIGSIDPLNVLYLDRLKALADRLEPAWVSDHLCWTTVDQHQSHDLLPLPYNEETLAHIIQRVQQVQEHLGRPLMLENASTYVTYLQHSMSEAEFLTALVKATGCFLLLDVNNAYVNAYNHNVDPYDYIDGLPLAHVGQVHLAGHEDREGYKFDTHYGPVIEPVWELYHYALHKAGRPISSMIEWDQNFPPFESLIDQVEQVRQQAKRIDFNGPPPNKKTVETPNHAANLMHENKANNVISLASYQRQFAQHVMPALAKKSSSNVIELSDYIQPQSFGLGDEQLAIYRRGYMVRMGDSIAEDYPFLFALLGEAEAVAQKLLRFVTPQDYDIGAFAGRVAEQWPKLAKEFMPSKTDENTTGVLQAAIVYEQAMLSMPYAPKFQPVDSEMIKDMGLEQLMQMPFALNPGIKLLHLDFAVQSEYLSLRKHKEVISPLAQRAQDDPLLQPQSSFYGIVPQQDGSLRHLLFDPLGYRFLIIIKDNPDECLETHLSVLIESGDVDVEQLSQHLTSWFAQWFKYQVFATRS